MFNPLAPLDDDEQNARDPFGRVMPKAEPDHVISNLGNPAALDQPVGEQGRNDRRDVARVETMLGRTGALDLKKTDGPTGYWGERTRAAMAQSVMLAPLLLGRDAEAREGLYDEMKRESLQLLGRQVEMAALFQGRVAPVAGPGGGGG